MVVPPRRVFKRHGKQSGDFLCESYMLGGTDRVKIQ